MNCSFDKLIRYLDKDLDVDGQLDVLNHIDVCEICRDVIYALVRDRDEALFEKASDQDLVLVD